MNEYKCFSYPHQHLICIMHNLSIKLHSYIFGSNCKRKHLHSLHHSSSPLLHSFIHSFIHSLIHFWFQLQKETSSFTPSFIHSIHSFTPPFLVPHSPHLYITPPHHSITHSFILFGSICKQKERTSLRCPLISSLTLL
jgi:hypothetical protein